MDLPAVATNLEPLLASIATQLNLTPDKLQLLPIATGKHNASFWLIAEADRWVLRIAPPDTTGLLFYERTMMRQEPLLHQLIRSRTQIPVPEVVIADFSRIHCDRDYLLMQALPGEPLSQVNFGVEQRDRVLYQVGFYLRQLHELTAVDCLETEYYGYLGLHDPMLPQPSWEAAFRVMWNSLLDDVVASGCYSDREYQLMSDLLEQYIHCFDYADVPRLLHMDVWTQNILVDAAANVTGLIDFDRALWGDPEIEFAVLDYCGISEPAFWQGYGLQRDQSQSAQIRQRFYLLYEMQKYMPIAVWRSNNLQRALMFKQKSLALAQTLV